MSLVERIRAHGGDVTQDQWRIRLKPGSLDASALEYLKRPDVRMRLRREVWPIADDWSERAAIREYDGGQDRDEAERDAYQEVIARC